MGRSKGTTNLDESPASIKSGNLTQLSVQSTSCRDAPFGSPATSSLPTKYLLRALAPLVATYLATLCARFADTESGGKRALGL